MAGTSTRVGSLDDPVWSQPTSSHDDDRPAPTGDRHGRRRLCLAVLGVVGVTSVATWLLTGLDGPFVPTVAAVATSCIGIFAVACTAHPLAPRHPRDQWLGLIATGIAGAAVVALSWSGTLVSAKVGTEEAAWQRAADQAVTQATSDRQGCLPPPAGDATLPGIGTVVARCVLLPGPHNDVQVRFLQRTGPGAAGVVYLASGADVTQQWDWCVAHLDGPWWRIHSSTDGTCPTGSRFIGAG